MAASAKRPSRPHRCRRDARTKEGARRSPRSRAGIRSAMASAPRPASQERAGGGARYRHAGLLARQPRSRFAYVAPRKTGRRTDRAPGNAKARVPVTLAARCCYTLLQLRLQRYSRICSDDDRSNRRSRCQGDPEIKQSASIARRSDEVIRLWCRGAPASSSSYIRDHERGEIILHVAGCRRVKRNKCAPSSELQRKSDPFAASRIPARGRSRDLESGPPTPQID